MLDDALELLAFNLSVIPLAKQTKLPPARCTWKEQQNILPTEQTIKERFNAHPDCNLGIITGVASGVVVIDADSENACKWVEKTFPNTWLTVNTSGRGKHYYFKYPKFNDDQRIKSTNSIIHPNVDVKGHGGLVVVPPAIHESGEKYTWSIAERHSLNDIRELPVCPIDIPGILTKTHIEPMQQNQEYPKGALKNIARECAWLRHCRKDAVALKRDELLRMTGIVARCEDGCNKAHKLLKIALGFKYNFNKSQKNINETINNMGPVTCRTISTIFENCFECKNLGRGKNFSPIILSVDDVISSDIEIVTQQNIVEKNEYSLQIPDKILNPGGLISEGIEALNSPDAPNIPQYNYPLVISLIARAIVGKVVFNHVWPNFYHIKIGSTSTGKSDSDHKIVRALEFFDCDNFLGPDNFASGPGLLRGLQKQSQCIIILDEITYLFQRFDKSDPTTSGKIEALLTLFTMCGLRLQRVYSDKKNNITISNPCLILLGNATTNIFNNIRPEDFTSGLMQRFTFWYYAGDIPYRKPHSDDINNSLNDFLDKIIIIFNLKEDTNELSKIINTIHELKIDNSGYSRLEKYSKFIVDSANEEDDESKKGIISRKYYESIKYALVHWCNENFNINTDLTVNDIDYGIAVSNMLSDWKLNVLYEKVKEGDFHRLCDTFKDGIKAAIKAGKAPTGKAIVSRRQALKNIRPHEFDNIIHALAARKEIIVDNSKSSTQYFLIKDKKL